MLLLRSSLGLRLSIGLSVPTLYLSSQILYPRPRSIIQCQSAPYLNDRISETRGTAPSRFSTDYDSEHPRSIFNPTNFRQISTGSFGGVLAGYLVGRLSKILAFVTIMLAITLQYLERKGFHVIPYQKLRGVVNDVDAKKMITENWAFRWSFAAAFMLSAASANF